MNTTQTILALSAIAVVAAYSEHKRQQADPDIIPMGALPLGFNAMTVPPVGVFVRKDMVSNQFLLDHEKEHWQQYRDRGLLGFYRDYFGEWITYGYDHMPMEIAARKVEDEYCKTNYSACVRAGCARTVCNENFRIAG